MAWARRRGATAAALLGVGIGAPTLAAAAALAAALTLLVSIAVRPLRRPVPRRADKPVRATFAYRWSRTIQRHPWRWLFAATALLLVLAAPVTSIRLGWADEGNFPEGTPTRQAYDLLAEAFGDGFNGPFLITVVPGPEDSVEAVQALQQALSRAPGAAAVSAPTADDPTRPAAYLLSLVTTTAPQDPATTDLVNHLRESSSPRPWPAPAST